MLTPEQYENLKAMVKDRLKEVREVSQIGPSRASEIQVELSSLLAGVDEILAEREYWFNVGHDKILTECDNVAARANIKAKATKEWHAWKDCEGLQKAIVRNLRTIESYLRRSSEAERNSRY